MKAQMPAERQARLQVGRSEIRPVQQVARQGKVLSPEREGRRQQGAQGKQ